MCFSATFCCSSWLFITEASRGWWQNARGEWWEGKSQVGEKYKKVKVFWIVFQSNNIPTNCQWALGGEKPGISRPGGKQTLWLCQLQPAEGGGGGSVIGQRALSESDCSAATKEGDETRGVAGTQRAASLERHQSVFCPGSQTLQSCRPVPWPLLVHMCTNVNTHMQKQFKPDEFRESLCTGWFQPNDCF